MANKRIEWIDALKGFGMILVILGHMTIPEVVRHWIFSFHMPLFFFISGYLFSGSFSKEWARRKIKTLLFAYVVYSALALLVVWIVGKSGLGYATRWVLKGNGIGVTWFLMCLLLTELVGGVLVNQIKECPRWFVWMVVALMAALGWMLPRLGLLPCVLMLPVVPSALAFWLAGYAFKSVAYNWKYAAIGLAFALFWPFTTIDMQGARYGNGFILYAVAFGHIVALFYLFSRFNIVWRWLVFVGGRSLEFMGLHASLPMLITWFALQIIGTITPWMKMGLRLFVLVLLIVAADGAYRLTRKALRRA